MASTTDPAPASGAANHLTSLPVTGQPQSPPSDNDSGERPVRKQLKETSIESAPTTADEPGNGRKRSFEDSRGESNSSSDNGESRRKRSRDCTPLDDTEITTSLDASTSAKSENVSAINPMESPLAYPLDNAEKSTSPGPETGPSEHELSENSPAPKSPTPSNDWTWKPKHWTPYEDSVIPPGWLKILSKAKPVLSDNSETDETSGCTELDPEILPDSQDEQPEESSEGDETSESTELDPEIFPASQDEQSEGSIGPYDVDDPIDSLVYPPACELFPSNAITDWIARAESAPLEFSHASTKSESRSRSAPSFKSNIQFEDTSHHERLPPPEYFDLDSDDDCYPPSESVRTPVQADYNGAPYCPPPEIFDLDDDEDCKYLRTEPVRHPRKVDSNVAPCPPTPKYFDFDEDDCQYLRTERVQHPPQVDKNDVPWCPTPQWDRFGNPAPLNSANLEHPESAQINHGNQCHPVPYYTPEAISYPQAAVLYPPVYYVPGYGPQPTWTEPVQAQSQYPQYPSGQMNGLAHPYLPGFHEPLDANSDRTFQEYYENRPLRNGLSFANQHEEPNQPAEYHAPRLSLFQEPVPSSLDAPNDQDSEYSELEIFPPDPSDHDDSIIHNLQYDESSSSSEEPTARFSSEKEVSSPHTPALTEPGKEEKQNNNNNSNLQGPQRSTPTDTPSSTRDDESYKSLNKKRSREQLEDSGPKNDTKNDTVQDPIYTNSAGAKSTTDGEREKKRPRDDSQERETKTENAFAASAFGKAAAASPFASLGSTKDSADKPASASPFASSTLAGFAGSENSPFGTLGASTSSVFKPATTGASSFATPSTTSGFGSLGSGFSGVGGGFAAAAKPSGLTSFASSNAPATLGATKTKAFGAEDSEGDESDNNDDEEETNTFEAAKTDERFYEQTIETGEEEEVTVFSCKAKLFGFVNKEWKERGIGTFKLNATQTDDGYANGRMIMRADGAMRVMLNSPIFSGMNYGDTDNNAPTTKQILLTGNEEGRRVPMLLRTGSEAMAQELHEHIKGLLGKSD
ncbi:hypothetical protein N7456_011169 [Penicillium angulare]|uniref:RanBD1 domain-containing protein n=1 Tax=Penicillium angulare TaxID=116970 RepID=A0A9W9JZM1_9EURO|nr:hypothetical protein N7456_011169 [Penicillium angulare]